MKRRTLLQWLASTAASWPLMRADLSALDLATAQELQPDQIFVLHDVAATVLPSSIGRKGQDEAVDNFLRWLREYKEGVALSHGYGEPRLVKSGPSPGSGYRQSAERAAAGRASAWRTLWRAAARRPPRIARGRIQGR